MFRGSIVLIPLAPTVACQTRALKKHYNAGGQNQDMLQDFKTLRRSREGLYDPGSISICGQSSGQVA